MEEILEKNNLQLIYTVAQGSTELGYVVIDSTVGGRSYGGLRMLEKWIKPEANLLSLGLMERELLTGSIWSAGGVDNA